MVSTFRLAGTQPTPPPRAVVGLQAPSFPALDHVRGPVIINFFATWCSDCRTDAPVIAKAAVKSGGRITVIGVDCCGDQHSAVAGFLRELNGQDQFREIAYDDWRIARAYAVLGPPTTAILDKDHDGRRTGNARRARSRPEGRRYHLTRRRRLEARGRPHACGAGFAAGRRGPVPFPELLDGSLLCQFSASQIDVTNESR